VGTDIHPSACNAGLAALVRRQRISGGINRQLISPAVNGETACLQPVVPVINIYKQRVDITDKVDASRECPFDSSVCIERHYGMIQRCRTGGMDRNPTALVKRHQRVCQYSSSAGFNIHPVGCVSADRRMGQDGRSQDIHAK